MSFAFASIVAAFGAHCSGRIQLLHKMKLQAATENRKWVTEGTATDQHGQGYKVQLVAGPVGRIPTTSGTQCLVRTLYISTDPYLSRWASQREEGTTMRGNLIGEVLQSGAGCTYAPGSFVLFNSEYAQYNAVASESLVLLPHARRDILPSYVGALGMPGLTAYIGIFKIGHPKRGEVAYVSAAAGAVGSVAVEIFKSMGLTVIASAGSDEEVEYLKSVLGADASFNYHDGPIGSLLSKAMANVGKTELDIYFEMVGGETMEAALDHMANRGRVIYCGAISQYRLTREEAYGVRNLEHILWKRLTIQGYIYDDWGEESLEEARAQLTKWYDSGKLSGHVTVVDGWDSVPVTFLSMYDSGGHTGKMVIKVTE